MYIKIKHIKQFSLIFTCFFLAAFNYLHFVKADSNIANKSCDTSIDSDCDGLTNEEEKLYGTDPNNPDTGHCGYSDGVNVKAGYNPLTCKKFSDGQSTISNSTSSSVSTSTSSLTESFSEDLKKFVDTKGSQPITKADLNNFVSTEFSSQPDTHITVNSLPEIDSSQIKILPQNYSSLSEADRKTKMQQDAVNYYSQIAYILVSNSPTPLITDSDFEAFGQDFQEHALTFATANPDFAYFTDLGNRMDLALTQINDVVVPQSLLQIHIKALRIIKGFLSLRDTQHDYATDPISKIILLTRIQDLSNIAADFFENDFQKYNQSLQ